MYSRCKVPFFVCFRIIYTVGTYSPRTGAGSCLDCPVGSYSSGLGTYIHSVTDRIGQIPCLVKHENKLADFFRVFFRVLLLLASTTCPACPVNTYGPDRRSQACYQCPDRHITSFSGQQSVNDCFVPTTGFMYDPVTDSSKTCEELLIFDVDEATDESTRQRILSGRMEQKGNGYWYGSSLMLVDRVK